MRGELGGGGELSLYFRVQAESKRGLEPEQIS